MTGTPYGEPRRRRFAEDGPQQVGLGRHRGAAALAGDLRRRAAEVDVDVVDAIGVAQHADRLAEHHRIAAVDLQAARLLVGAERHHPLGLGVAVHDAVAITISLT